MDRVLLTKQGAEKLRERLRHLKDVERPKVIQAIAEASAHGDLSENAEYWAAREQQGFIEGNIRALESNLAVAEIVDPSTMPQTGRVVFGSKVEVTDLDRQQNEKHHIVGDFEAVKEEGQISINSPLARALIGLGQGEEAVVSTPGGDRRLRIVAIS